MQSDLRRYDIDWWRVIAILAVYLHHIGMPFNGDGFHIMNEESSKLLDDLMVFFEQFRLPMLFLISGTGTVYAFSKRNWIQFIKERSYRLLIPLFFGILFIVPPQTFFENREQFTSYFSFYNDLLSHIEVNHLWFIGNLFWMSAACIPIILYLRSSRSDILKKYLSFMATKKYGILLWGVLLILIKILSKKYYPGDSKSILNLSSTLYFGYYFIAGIVFASSGILWQYLLKHRKTNFYLALICSMVFYTYYYLPDEIVSPYLSLTTQWNIWYAVSGITGWSWIITALGYGQVWFNKRSMLLSKMNEAIYPFYILHQTVIVLLAYYLVQLDLSIGVKMLLLLALSFPVIVLIYRFIVYPFRITRVLFGMRSKPKVKETALADVNPT
ncbi:acyltransferase [Ascidiimonas aurantiaca]|uniref:acyltransferase n=1 Tax=Ascidiimonas aurantiaca TaxID=1685432 RepID=UPI0030EC7247